MHKTKYDDGFQNHLTIGANLVGDPGIVELMDLHNTQVPKRALIAPESKVKRFILLREIRYGTNRYKA